MLFVQKNRSINVAIIRRKKSSVFKFTSRDRYHHYL